MKQPKPNEYLGEIRAKTESSADLYFYGDIVSSWWGAWDDADQYPESIKNFLDSVKGIPNLNIYINSGGGSCYAGMAIYNMLYRHKAYKTVYVDGLAASMASIIALCGDKIIIPSNAWMMIHQPWSYSWGNADDMMKDVNALRAIEEGMLNTYCSHLKQGVTREQIYGMMQAETWMTGDNAAEYFNIEVSTAQNAEAHVSSEYYGKYRNLPQGFAIESEPEPEQPNRPNLKSEPTPEYASSLARAKFGLKLSLTRRG